MNYSSLNCQYGHLKANIFQMNGDIFHFKASQSDDIHGNYLKTWELLIESNCPETLSD